MGSRQRREKREARRKLASGEPDDDDFSREWDTPEWRAQNVETNRLLIRYFPELGETYQREIVDDATWEEEGPFVVYSIVFYPFLEQALRTEPEDSALLDRIFDFINMLAEGEDYRRSNLAGVGIGEFLADDRTLRRRARPRLGPKMCAAIDAALA